jgi:hypothetical protein
MRWQAPELLSPYETQDSSKAGDVYGFACVCYEVHCHICLLDIAKFDRVADVFR